MKELMNIHTYSERLKSDEMWEVGIKKKLFEQRIILTKILLLALSASFRWLYFAFFFVCMMSKSK